MNKKEERYFKFELRSIDAWRDRDGWWWNNSFRLAEEDIMFAESALTSRQILAYLRKIDILSDHSKGKLYIENDGYCISINRRSNHEPILALIDKET
jgi:hypothetical protein